MKNKFIIRGSTVVAYNKRDGAEILFDVDDMPKLEGRSFCITYSNKGYVVTQDRERLPLKRKMYAHHLIISKAPSGMVVDHINGNKADNRKANLRYITHSESQHNKKSSKGYTWSKRHKKWKAEIMANYKYNFLGLFDTEDEARQAYLEAKKKHHPSTPDEYFN